MEYAHCCPKCLRRWTHATCDGIGNGFLEGSLTQGDVCIDCGSEYRPYGGVEFEDEFDTWVRKTRLEHGV